MRIGTLLLLLLSSAAGILPSEGCHRGKEPVVVNLLRDGKSKTFSIVEHRLLGFQASRPKTTSDRRIVVQSILLDLSRFEQVLADEAALSALEPDLVILDSPDQERLSAMADRSAKKSNACGLENNCPAFIPTWVKDDCLEAAEKTLKALASGT